MSEVEQNTYYKVMEKKTQHFLNLQGQTNQNPYLIAVEKAEGIYLWDKTGKKYMDMIAGVAVNNIGHCHPKVNKAVKRARHLAILPYVADLLK